MSNFSIVELILDEDNDVSGVEAISLVEYPAIEENFVALKDHKIEFKTIDEDKRVVVGLALIPNKPIYRRSEDREYYVYFSKDTVRKVAEKFIIESKTNNATLEHQLQAKGVSVVESWIVENPEKDKTAIYNLNAVEGSWAVVMRIFNDDVWDDVKKGVYKGLSIEGYFADKMPRPKESVEEALAKIEEEEAETLLANVKAIIKGDKRVKGGKRTELESYSDYPDSVKNNAKRGIELNDKENNKCATQVGKIRAQQLANGEPISVETIKRMYSYLSRAEEYYDEGDTSACGTISFLLWGGLAGKRWAESKLKDLDLIDLKAPCQDGYEMIGMKTKNGRLVPNCVPING